MSKELLQQALEALRPFYIDSAEIDATWSSERIRSSLSQGTPITVGHMRKAHAVYIEIEKALAQPVQPVPIALAFPHSADFSETTCPACDGKFYVEREAVQPDPRNRDYLTEGDLGSLMRFQETTDDREGYDIAKSAIKRLADLGVVQSHGFGKYSVTAFGSFALEHSFLQNPALPLVTDMDRDKFQQKDRAQPLQPSASAAQAEPLSDEQIYTLFSSIKSALFAIDGGSAGIPASRRCIVRAIELAHGIICKQAEAVTL